MGGSSAKPSLSALAGDGADLTLPKSDWRLSLKRPCWAAGTWEVY
jgi:hypothetical protein